MRGCRKGALLVWVAALAAGAGASFAENSPRSPGLPVPLAEGNLPKITAVYTPAVVTGGTAVQVWATVTCLNPVAVSCSVTPPDFGTGPPRTFVPLAWNSNTARYEAEFNLSGHFGNYSLAFFATNTTDMSHDGPAVSSTYLLLPDSYEVDDTPEQASEFPVFEEQWHTLHNAADEDWTVFFAATNYEYQINTVHSGQPLNTAIELEFQNMDGSFSTIETKDDKSDTGEQITFQPTANGFYYVRVYHGSYPNRRGLSGRRDVGDNFGDYNLVVTIPAAGPNQLIVNAIDKTAPNQVVDGAECTLVGYDVTKSFNGGVSVSYNLSADDFSVQVTTAPGYMPAEDPKTRDQVGNPDSIYGNPRHVRLKDDDSPANLNFVFTPVVQATGTVRDASTGEWLPNARPVFTATSGILVNQVANGYPMRATYRDLWKTAADGAFPAGVILVNANWKLDVTCDYYAPADVANAVVNRTRGAVVNLGTIWLQPLDANHNQLADGWESRYTWKENTPPADGDEDADGQSNFNEYLAGTDPTSTNSFFGLGCLLVRDPQTQVMVPSSPLVLNWPTAPGRDYQICGKEKLSDASWTRVGGPRTAGPAESSMQWEIPNQPAINQLQFFQVNLIGLSENP